MKKGLIEVLFYIVLVFGVSFLLTTYVGQRTRVNGESMYPTLHDDDNLIVDKVSYRFSDPRRYDIIVFPYRYKDMYFIKRIIGLPGETVQILDGYVYIDGKKLDEHFCDEKSRTQHLHPTRSHLETMNILCSETIAMPVKTVVFRMSGMSDAKRSSGVPGYASGHLNGRDLCRKGVFDESKRDY